MLLIEHLTSWFLYTCYMYTIHYIYNVIHIMYIYKHVYIHIHMYSKEVLALMIDTWQKDWHSIWIAYYELQRRTWTNGFVQHYFYLLPKMTTNLICPPSSGAGVSSTFLSGFLPPPTQDQHFYFPPTGSTFQPAKLGLTLRSLKTHQLLKKQI